MKTKTNKETHIKHNSTNNDILKQKQKRKCILSITQQTTILTQSKTKQTMHIKHNSTHNNILKEKKESRRRILNITQQTTIY